MENICIFCSYSSSVIPELAAGVQMRSTTGETGGAYYSTDLPPDFLPVPIVADNKFTNKERVDGQKTGRRGQKSNPWALGG